MTMVPLLSSRANSPLQVAGPVLKGLLVCLSCAASLAAQAPQVHYQHAGLMPPGAIGGQHLLRGGPLPGYFQPVEITAPQGAMISTAIEGGFAEAEPTSTKVGLLIGAVYRLKITNLPGHEGLEVYPTIEVIDRLYPPVGQEAKFPIPIELTDEELAMAIDGKFVTRVIYLEDPEAALPVKQDPAHQHYFEARLGENPLDAADALGRPVAILRMGARVPDAEGPDAAFLYGSPVLFKYHAASAEVCDDPEQVSDTQGPALRMAREPLPTARVRR